MSEADKFLCMALSAHKDRRSKDINNGVRSHPDMQWTNTPLEPEIHNQNMYTSTLSQAVNQNSENIHGKMGQFIVKYLHKWMDMKSVFQLWIYVIKDY